MILTILLAVVLNPIFSSAKNEPCSKTILYKKWTKTTHRSSFKNGTIVFLPETSTNSKLDPFSNYCQVNDSQGSKVSVLRLLTTANKSLSKGDCNKIIKRQFKGVDNNDNTYLIKITE